MVDPKQTNERTVGTEAGQDQAARKVWVKPRLETEDVNAGTLTGLGNTTADGGGAGHCVS
jgi:hypothetical protein